MMFVCGNLSNSKFAKSRQAMPRIKRSTNGSSDRGVYRVESSRSVYRNRWLKLREDTVQLPSGRTRRVGVVEFVEGVSVLALDTERRVALVEEYKHAIGRTTIEVVSGGIEGGERPQLAAKRELREETGLVARDWRYIGAVDPLTTAVSCTTHLFVATTLVHRPATANADEFVVVRWVPFAQALEMVEEGTITHATSCILLLRLALKLRS